MKPTDSDQRKQERQTENAKDLDSQSKRMWMYAKQQARQSSVSRIVRGYVPKSKQSFFNRYSMQI